MYVQHRMSVGWKLTLISLLMTLGFSDAGVATVAETFADSQRHHHRNHHALTHKLKFQEPEVLLDSQLERAPSLPSPEEIEDASRRSTEAKMCPNCLHHHLHSKYHERERGKHPLPIEIDSLRLEAIKRQILSKLGMIKKPNVTLEVSRDVVLQTLYRAQETLPSNHEEDTDSPTTKLPQHESEPDDFYGRTSEIITFAEPGHTLNRQQLLEFPHPQGTEKIASVKSAALWVRVDLKSSLSPEMFNRVRDRNLTFWIFRVLPPQLFNTTHLSGKEFDEYTEMSASLPVSMSSLGWQRFDLTSTVHSWYTLPGKEKLRLLVDCSGCNQMVDIILFQNPKAEKPFLVVHTEPTITRRVRRRAVDCSGAVKGQCCKQRFYVSFKEMGWDDWILAPTGYFANYCRGDCSGHRTPDTFTNYYSTVIEEYRRMDRLVGMQPCCAPLKFSSMSLIYFDGDQNILKRDLPKMVVDECGCP